MSKPRKIMTRSALLVLTLQSFPLFSSEHVGALAKDSPQTEVKGKLNLSVSHQKLDEALKKARDAGLTVKQESSQNRGNACGQAAISALQKTISEDYATQSANLEQAVAAYQKAVQKYNQEMKAYEQGLKDVQAAIDGNVEGAPAVAKGQSLNFLPGQNPNAHIASVKFSGAGDGALLKAKALSDGMVGLSKLTPAQVTTSPEFYDLNGTTSLFGLFLDPGQLVTIAYQNLKNITLNQTSVVELHSIFKNPSNHRIGLMVSRDPGNQFQFGVETNGRIFVNQPQMLQQSLQFLDGSGKVIAFSQNYNSVAQFQAGSLNYSSAKAEDGKFPPLSDGYNQHEAVSFNHNLVEGNYYPGGGVHKVSGMPVSGAKSTGDSWGVNPPETNETWTATSLNDYIYNGSEYDASFWDVPGNHKTWYAAVNLSPKAGQTKMSVTWSTTSGNMWADLNGKLPDQVPVPTLPTPPQKPSLSYHLNTATFQPLNQKAVTLLDDTVINGALVNKKAKEKWGLSNEALPAGREAIKSYVMTDSLPEGFQLDLEGSQRLNKDYDLSYDEEANRVNLTANPATLEAMNQNLNQTYQVPKAILQGQVTQDDFSYKNTFETAINDYQVTSNEVEIHTPKVVPQKRNENASGEVIDDWGISNQATNFYKLTWNLSGYQGMVASKEDIERGFFMVDDAAELVNVDLEHTRFTDSTDQVVEGIKATRYASVDQAPQDLQDRLKASEITPEGQFVVYEATDPQSFYNNYVQKGLDITIRTPMPFKEGATGDYENKVYQSDFGNGYAGNTVKNHIITPKATKQVSIDGGKSWQDSDKLLDNDSNYDYKLNFNFTAHGDYTSLQLKEEWQSVQWVDLSKVTVTAKDGKVIPGTIKVLDQAGKDVTEAYKQKTFQTDGKKEALWLVFTPNDLSDVTRLAASDDQEGAVELTLLMKDVTLKGASGKELSNYLNKDGKLEVTNVAQMETTSKTASGDSTKAQVTKTNVTKVTPPVLLPMINKYVYELGVGSSVELYGKDAKLPDYLSKLGQFTSLNLNKDKKVKVGDTVKWLIVAQSGNTSLMKNITDTLPKALSFAENPNIKAFVLSNDGKSLEEVTKDWKVEAKGQSLTATPSDPTKYYFAGSSTNSRVVVTLDTVLNESAKTGSIPNVATINTKDGKHKGDTAKVHTTVIPPKADETQKTVIEKITGALPKTGEGKAALMLSMLGVGLLGLVAYLKRRSFVRAYRKLVRKMFK
ncbi:SspB-related isopeptide-forming adhesin [Lactococcus lactis]|uniref:SspB-related isopeptide-forming adhesin n=1 Tax=Lactococcus lactis TaxID=1358 RepID=UPI001F5AEE92|nr:SspB-related isopeptide-forming adhesin [Lactococcus lactis]